MAQHFVFKGKDLGEFDPNEITMDDAMLLEDKTGFTVADLGDGASRLSGRATQALVWFMRVRAGEPNAPLHENFKFSDITSITVGDDDADAEPSPASDVDELEKVFAKSGTGTSDS